MDRTSAIECRSMSSHPYLSMSTREASTGTIMSVLPYPLNSAHTEQTVGDESLRARKQRMKAHRFL